MKKWQIETQCIQEGYKPKDGEPRVLPIYQSTTYKYDSSEHLAKLFNLEEPGHMYSRISNPTVGAVEEKIAALEGGVGAVCTSSGQSAIFISIINICNSGDHVISASNVYGGTINLFGVTLKKLGIEITFVDQDSTEEDIIKEIRPNTRAIYGEILSNPGMEVLDIEKFAKIAHDNKIPLIIDNTFPTPILCKPIEYGADIVIHSTSKYMDGHATVIGGAIVDSGKFNWENGKFSEFVDPDPSYHGLSYTGTFGEAAYITKARVQYIRDIGNPMNALTAFLTNLGLETLHLRMERHSENALKIAKHLEKHDKVESVNYPGLKGNKYYELANKYLPKGQSGVISFVVKGGREKAVEFLDKLELASIVVHVADARTSVIHPASSTHRQLNDEQLKAAKISQGLVRISVGIENADDIIADIDQAFK